MKRYKIRKEQLERVVESFVMENTKKETITEKEELNEIDPLTGLAIGAAGAAGIGAIATGLAKLEDYIDKLPNKDAKSKKVLGALRNLGDAAAKAKRGPSGGYKDNMKEEELNEIDPLTGLNQQTEKGIG